MRWKQKSIIFVWRWTKNQKKKKWIEKKENKKEKQN